MIKDEEDIFKDTVKIEVRIEDPDHLLGRYQLISRKLVIPKEELLESRVGKVAALIDTLNSVIWELEGFYRESDAAGEG